MIFARRADDFSSRVEPSTSRLSRARWSARIAAEAPAADAGNYVGPGLAAARSRVTARSARSPAPRILQTEYSTWVSQDRHARATEVLGNMVSQRMGRILGIGNPQQAQKCLACHSLDVPASAARPQLRQPKA